MKFLKQYVKNAMVLYIGSVKNPFKNSDLFKNIK